MIYREENKKINSEGFEYISIEELDKQQLENLKSRNIVGLDPGKRSLVYMMDGIGNKLQYTAPQRKKVILGFISLEMESEMLGISRDQALQKMRD